MTISVQCEECFQSYKVKDERAGQTLKCKSCGSKMRVPAVEEEFEDLSADYGEPIAQPRKKQAGKAKKKKSSPRKSLNISAGGIVKKTFGVGISLLYVFCRRCSRWDAGTTCRRTAHGIGIYERR